ncbi:MAG: high-potential iron-sulfur protein [Myxococcales bacterium]|nr:high-potential iron-sulfur protein [Myxococcales bacterium]
MSEQYLSRRAFFSRAAKLGAAAIAVSALPLAACNKGGGEEGAASCDDGLSPASRQARTAIGYVNDSTDPAKTCSSCALFQAPAEGAACGACTLPNIGSVNPAGTCNSWAAAAG